jgi:hypothetical protein
VAEYYSLTAADLTGRSRTAPVAFARHIAMRGERPVLPAIGDQLGGVTIRPYHGVEKVTPIWAAEQLRRDISTHGSTLAHTAWHRGFNHYSSLFAGMCHLLYTALRTLGYESLG